MMAGWWPTKVRQFVRHIGARMSRAERAELAGWLTGPQMELFESMHPADKRHGLDVVRALRQAGHDEPDVLLAGLLHDSGKGPSIGVWHRVGWSLGVRYGSRVRAVVVRLPGFNRAFDVLDAHAQTSAALALVAGCSERCAALIRHQDDPIDDTFGEALRLADEAN